MVYKKIYCGQRTGKTIRKQHLALQSKNGLVAYTLIDRLDDSTAENLQKCQNRKGAIFLDGREIPILLNKDNDPKFEDLPSNLNHGQENDVLFSLNKYKRWSLPAQLQNNLESLSEEDFRVVLFERKSLMELQKRVSQMFTCDCRVPSHHNDCVRYLDSKTSPSCAKPAGTAASFFCDLREKCIRGENSGRKVTSKNRRRHNMHNRGIQRKSELHRQEKVCKEKNYLHF